MTDNNKSLMRRIRGAGWGAVVLLVAFLLASILGVG